MCAVDSESETQIHKRHISLSETNLSCEIGKAYVEISGLEDNLNGEIDGGSKSEGASGKA